MASSVTVPQRKLPPAVYVAAALMVAVLLAGGFYLSRPSPRNEAKGPSSEAKAYLPNIHLSGVEMKAAENFMRQQVVYLSGEIANSGSREIKRIDVYCIFSGVDGRDLYREPRSITGPMGGATGGLRSGQTRPFQLTFDNLPDGWNQAMPKLVIAGIDFGR